VQLPTLLSQALVAFTIKFDNEFEHQGVDVGKLEQLARTPKNLKGMVRWGYIAIGADRVVRAAPKGRMAQQVLRPPGAVIEQRWRTEKRWRARYPTSRTFVERIRAVSRRMARGGSQPATLPHYPIMLHRGGFPDGS
jgi:hypothetical protein